MYIRILEYTKINIKSAYVMNYQISYQPQQLLVAIRKGDVNTIYPQIHTIHRYRR